MSSMNIGLLLILIILAYGQQFQAFQTGMVKLQPQTFAIDNSYRNFTIQPQNGNFIQNGQLVYSFVSFNYFINEIHCYTLSNQPLIVVQCSPNVYKLSFMLLESSPNIFTQFLEKTFIEKDKSVSYALNISSWVNQLKIPLKSLLKQNQNDLLTGNQYQIECIQFLSGIKTFSSPINANGSLSTNKYMIGTIKLDSIYLNLTLDQQNNLLIPAFVNISRTLNIKYVSFFTVIIIKQIPSLNLQFQSLSLDNQSGITYFGHFMGISQLQFYLPHQDNNGQQKIGFNFTYRIPPIQQIPLLNKQNFYIEKLSNYSLGKNLRLKITKLQNFYYKRCYGAQITHYDPLERPQEGKYYKIMTGMDWNYVIDFSHLTDPNKLVLYQWQNIDSQIFYFQYLGNNKYKIFSAKTNKFLRARNTTIANNLGLIDPIDQNQNTTQLDIWRIFSVQQKGTNKKYFQIKSFYQKFMDVANNRKVNENTVFTWKVPATIGTGNNQIWNFGEVDMTVQNSTFTVNNNSLSGLNNAQTISSTNNQIIKHIYYENYTTFLSNSTLSNVTPYGYYSMSNEVCYVTPCLNQTNKYYPTQMPYNFITNSSFSDFENATSNSLIATSNSSYYAFCVDNLTLLDFYTKNTLELTQFLSIQNSNNSSLFQLKSHQNMVGCKIIKSLNNEDQIIECQECKEGYTLYESHIRESSQQNVTVSKNCYCNFGLFMDSFGICQSCDNHPQKCKINLKIQAEVIKFNSIQFTSSKNQILSINISVTNQNYQYFTDLENIASQIIVYINGIKYKPNNHTLKFLSQSTDMSFIINVKIDEVPKSTSYRVSAYLDISNDQPITNSYLLLKENTKTSQNQPILTATQINPNQTAQNQTSSNFNDTIYFTKFQTSQILIIPPYQIQKVTQSLQPLIMSINKSASLMILAAPFLADKISIFSFLQTNALLYMISFLKFENNNQTNDIQNLAAKMFIFKPEPLLEFFTLKSVMNKQNKKFKIQIPKYTTNLSYNALYLEQFTPLNYPSNLYKTAIPSLYNTDNDSSQNSLTIVLNCVFNILLQILVIQIVIILITLAFSKQKIKPEQNSPKEELKQKAIQIECHIERHNILDIKENNKNKKQKYIKWLPMPKIEQITSSLTSISLKNSSTQEVKVNSQEIKLDKKQSQITFRHHIIFFIQQIKQKRAIFYTSFVIAQLISHSYLLYFEIIKPLNLTSDDTLGVVFNYFDSCFGMFIMFVILIFPVFLINYEPLYLLKIVQITYKFGNQQVHNKIQKKQKKQQKQINNKAEISQLYTYEEIFFHFCIIYYENLIIPFSVAIGSTIFYQSLPILLFQIFKLIWMYNKLKILDKVKTILLCLLFTFSTFWGFTQNQDRINYIFKMTIISCIYAILIVQFVKLLKFIIVFIFKTLRTKIQHKKQTQSENQISHKIKKQLLNEQKFQIFDIQQENTTTILQQQIPYGQFGSEKLMLDKKAQKLDKIKQKSKMLRELTDLRQNLQSDLVQMKNRRKKSRLRPNLMTINKIIEDQQLDQSDLDNIQFTEKNEEIIESHQQNLDIKLY